MDEINYSTHSSQILAKIPHRLQKQFVGQTILSYPKHVKSNENNYLPMKLETLERFFLDFFFPLMEIMSRSRFMQIH